MAARGIISILDSLDERDRPIVTALPALRRGKFVGWEPATHPYRAAAARVIAGALDRLVDVVAVLHSCFLLAEHAWSDRAYRWGKRPIYDVPKKAVWCFGNDCGE